MARTRVTIQSADFDLGAEIAALRAGDAGVGAVASFIGTVRDRNDGLGVSAMELAHYPGMTERAIEAMIDAAIERFEILGARVIHRIGLLQPQDQIMMVAVSSAHRAAAFQACEFLMDYLKTRRTPPTRPRETEPMPALPLSNILAVAFGGVIGCLLRWLAGLWLNARWGGFPLGTLLVNLVGGLLIGAALAWFSRTPNELLRLLLVTGFLGGLTTFSSFTGELLSLLQRGDWPLAFAHVAAHLLGSLGCAAIGFWLMQIGLGPP
jgi:protein CrcB